MARLRIDVDELVQSIGYRDTRDYIIEEYLHNKGATYESVALHLGVSVEVIRNRMKTLDLKPKARGRRQESGVLAALSRLRRREERTPTEQAHTIEHSPDYVRRLIGKHNLPCRRPHQPPIIKQLKKKGVNPEEKTFEEICKILPTYEKNVIKFALKNAGLKCKNGL